MDYSPSTLDLVASQRPDTPVFCYRPAALKAAADWFTARFPGDVFYAVKANPAPHILQGLWEAGIRGFDVASPGEVEQLAAQLPGATLAFMHPVKNRAAIARAYHEHGVRRFVLDSAAELNKILDATGHARDLTLVVRIGVSNEGATVPLTGKFGATEDEAPALLRAARTVSQSLGVSFHVGSQAMNPGAWRTAMEDVSRLIQQAGVTVDIVDVGGGFPARYDSDALPMMEAYAGLIDQAFEDMSVLQTARLWSEPGRALVAEAESLLVGIDGAKPGALYLNDGGFGALYDAVHLDWPFPIRAIKADGTIAHGSLAEYVLYGPTCDSADRLARKLSLPEGLGEGDYLEFGNIGAYGRAMATRFNGYGRYETVEVADRPFASAYPAPLNAARIANA